MDKFFLNNTYVIDEKVQVLKLTNGYKVYDANNNEIGLIKENMPGSRILLSLIVSKQNLPMTLEVYNMEGKMIASLTRGFTLFMSNMKVLDENGTQVATIKQKFGLKPKFELLDMSGAKIATIQGNWTAWDFNITDTNNNPLGSISKKFNGLAKELFTDADKYVVNIEPSVTDEAQRIAIASTAAAIDMILKENN
ncbi:MAG: hypothetical protein KBT33_10475 [Prevotellaceae bacterium]|nr:hypothetical protein [Candidatus Minthosoma equi]